MLRFFRRSRPVAEPYEIPAGTPCFFHESRPAVVAEGFAAMCAPCAEDWRYRMEQR